MDDIKRRKIDMVEQVVTHLIDALGDSGVSMRRALILIDVDEHPQTTQAESTERLDEDKSTMSRNIDWLVDHGCVDRKQDIADARVMLLRSSDFSARHIGYALTHFSGSHKDLKNFVIGFIQVFEGKMPTLREAQILATLGAMDGASPSELSERLQGVPASTQRRILAAFSDDGLIEKDGTSV